MPGFKKSFYWGWRLLVLIFIMDTGYLIGIWPNWDIYKDGPILRSNFIRTYIATQPEHKDWPPLKWEPVSIRYIPDHIARAIIISEDARFYSHSGIDTAALKDAMEYNLERGRFAYGGSTISQQTIKNIFLSPSRNPFRKWHEFVLTLGMERNLGKKRILELYMNLAEFGRGIYGVNAASYHYWGKHVSMLNQQEAIELAATLPSPVKHNPNTRTTSFKKRVRKISRYFYKD